MAGGTLSQEQRTRLAQTLIRMSQAFLRYRQAIMQLGKEYLALLRNIQQHQEQQKIQKILEEIKK
ncbi:MAG: hypothetical protein A3B74_04520 [Candidatus Kerfeldbacteria bacterium RIFCSPHIGHO2_02_FULL_42_14]|uniref:Uncharacterized protein n=1 Tax=Candidatus Kerfeldbacteria bacterium RIFCSPHIGHO2_02_FULL_42_14 TaxID=1798540 RepID=A0A1G2ARK4_9BACT|nr:MAG: hypothetical protein A3B74_04520 [Candidatus Kerfeldbacteria bacterium RIFCSPHIGHO2_02_FULL_42_14]OGY80801.1 MAG: hypothetical protein A3E60_01300 [Candidatus Kerfeldbacteria bacterium RIFCSPHIGHO2_12_FULL_42_13]OGY84972.1 MAG: hypothetical protein A3I91_00635 [Candidatus Kerfeldbacteria bacterium RIFCSPLOWO2_02_FULL_42_19]OGY86140.1 MAG: hypothetical protein A3G01_02170 [Candidatus Kerfeldbacteria bacterium RIFCSPLOWO2_12_FULL_43_9]